MRPHLTSRTKIICYRFTLSPVAPPKIEMREEATKTSIVFGRDAMRWAKEDPERFIGVYTDTYPISNGYRPAP